MPLLQAELNFPSQQSGTRTFPWATNTVATSLPGMAGCKNWPRAEWSRRLPLLARQAPCFQEEAQQLFSAQSQRKCHRTSCQDHHCIIPNRWEWSSHGAPRAQHPIQCLFPSLNLDLVIHVLGLYHFRLWVEALQVRLFPPKELCASA